MGKSIINFAYQFILYVKLVYNMNMKRSSKKVINISREIAPILNSRDVIRDLSRMVKKLKSKKIDLDFKDVKFVSRSAAHELLILKEKLSMQKDIKFVNSNSEVENMIRLVASNRAVSKKEKIDFKVERISIHNLCHSNM